MGYRVDTSATLVLEGMDGAEVSVKIGIPLRGLREWFETTTREAEWAAFVKWAQPVWNLEDADGPIPVDDDAFFRLPPSVSTAMQKAWREAVVNPPAPLPQTSGSTEP